MFKEALAKLKLPKGFKVQIDPWPYGGPDPDEQALRCELLWMNEFQCKY